MKNHENIINYLIKQSVEINMDNMHYVIPIHFKCGNL